MRGDQDRLRSLKSQGVGLWLHLAFRRHLQIVYLLHRCHNLQRFHLIWIHPHSTMCRQVSVPDLLHLTAWRPFRRRPYPLLIS